MPVVVKIKKKISTQLNQYGEVLKTKEENLERGRNDKIQERIGKTKEAPKE